MNARDQLTGTNAVPDVSMVAWNISARCNLRCAHCYIGPEALDGDTDGTSWRETADEIAALGAGAVFLAGGEPLLHPEIDDVIRRLHDGGSHVFLNTNALLLTAERCRALIAAGLDGIIVGFDGIDEPTYDAIRGRKTYARAIAGLHVARQEGLGVEVDFTLNRRNIHQLAQLPAWGDAMGLARITIKRYVPRPGSRADAELRLDPPSLHIAYATLLAATPDLTTRAGCRVFAHDPLMIVAKSEAGCLREEDILREDCNAGAYVRGWIGVDAQGLVSPCPVMTEMKLDPRRSSWDAVVHSTMFDKVRDTLPAVCTSCAHARYCRGGCRATKVRLGLPLSEPDPCCWLANG